MWKKQGREGNQLQKGRPAGEVGLHLADLLSPPGELGLAGEGGCSPSGHATFEGLPGPDPPEVLPSPRLVQGDSCPLKPGPPQGAQ